MHWLVGSSGGVGAVAAAVAVATTAVDKVDHLSVDHFVIFINRAGWQNMYLIIIYLFNIDIHSSEFS